MAGASVVHVFLDTNTVLHYKRADQVDWCTLVDATEVVLVIAPVLMRELEHQKVHNPSRKLRERADGIVKWLAQFLRSSTPRTVRPGVTLCFVDHELQVDFVAQRLSPTVADDQLIASVLDHMQAHTERTLVATADLGLEAKLRGRRIELLLLPDELRLPGEPDPLEKELQQTRLELQRLKSRSPRLGVTFANGSHQLQVTLSAPPHVPSAPSLYQIQTDYPPLAKPGRAPRRSGAPIEELGGIAGALNKFGVSAEATDRYNDELQKFYASHGAYLEKLLIWEEQHARSLEVTLILSNNGTAPASDIDVVLTFPEDIELFEPDDLPQRPEAPEPPPKPTPFWSLAGC